MKKPALNNFIIPIFLSAAISSAILLYGRGIDNYFVSDDWGFLFLASKAYSLSDVLDLCSFHTNWFVRPTQWITTWIIYQGAGLNQAPYHIVSLILEICCALILGLFTHRLLKAYQQTTDPHPIIAITVGVLFLFNWRHHEAVFWYSSINELLASFFKLSTLLLISYLILQNSRIKIAYIFIASLWAFALAIFSKESAVVLPLEVALLLFLDYFVRNRNKRRLNFYILLMIPFISLLGLWAYSYLQTAALVSANDIERSGLSILHSSPINLMFRFLQYFNGTVIGTGFISNSIPLMIIELCALAVFTIVALIRKRYISLFALFWTFISIAPYAGMTSTDAVDLQIPVLMLGVTGDRFLHYPASGASLLIVTAAQWLLDESKKKYPGEIRSKLLQTALGVTLMVFIGLNAYKIFKLESEWEIAGNIGRNIIHQINELAPNPAVGDILCIGNLPDNYQGRYVFRNKISSALYLAYSRNDFTTRATVQPPYTFKEPPPLDESNCSYILYYDGYTMTEKLE